MRDRSNGCIQKSSDFAVIGAFQTANAAYSAAHCLRVEVVLEADVQGFHQNIRLPDERTRFRTGIADVSG